jgi:DNA-binding response OmpR family regulator
MSLVQHLLLAGGNEAWSAATSSELRRLGYEVSLASAGDAALERINAEMIDLVICDVQLPEVDGFEVLARLHSLHRRLPVILVADDVDNESIVRARTAGALHLLVKPLATEVLVKAIRALVPLANPGPLHPVESLPAAEARRELSKALRRVQNGPIEIRRHDSAAAVLLSVDTFEVLVASQAAEQARLTRRFDAMFEAMQTRKAREALDAAFAATSEQLGDAAVVMATGRG